MCAFDILHNLFNGMQYYSFVVDNYNYLLVIEII